MSNRQQRRANRKQKGDEKAVISFTPEQWDWIVMKEACSGVPLRQEILDVAGKTGKYAWQSLDKACYQQKIVLEGAHRAQSDTLATWKLLRAMAEKE